MSIATDNDVASGVQCVDCMINWREKKIDTVYKYPQCGNSFIRGDWRNWAYFIPSPWFLLFTEIYIYIYFVLKVWIFLPV